MIADEEDAMTITIRFWRRLANFEPDYAKRIAKNLEKEC